MVQLQVRIKIINGKHLYTIDELKDCDGCNAEEINEIDRIYQLIIDNIKSENDKIKVAKV